MGTSPAADYRVNFVDDHRAHGTEHLPAALGGEEQVERLGRGHQDVRRRLHDPRALGGGRVSRPNSRCDRRYRQPARTRGRRYARTRLRQVLVNVGAQRLERRYVDDADFVGQRPAEAFAEQRVKTDKKRTERLAGTGRRGDQRVATRLDLLPPAHLRWRRRANVGGEPLSDKWM